MIAHRPTGDPARPDVGGTDGRPPRPTADHDDDAMAIACITFDLDDTLWESESVLANAEARLYEWIERVCPDIARAHSYDALLAHRHAHYASIPEIRHDLTRARILWLESLLREWGYASDLAATGFGVFREHRNAVTLFDGVTRVLGKLGERYSIGAITNGNADVHRIGIGHHFDFVVTPAEAGAAKPDSAIFECALSAGRCLARERRARRRRPPARRGGRVRPGAAHRMDEPQGTPLARQDRAGRRDSRSRRPRSHHRRLALTALFPRLTDADADLAGSAALNAAGGLDVPSPTPARPGSRSPRRFRPLRASLRESGQYDG